MIDKPTIARIMDSTKIEEVVSEFCHAQEARHQLCRTLSFP